MEPTTVRQLQGVTALLQDAVESAAGAIEDAHRQLARRPFDLLAGVSCLASPVRIVERAHDVVLDGVYASICGVTRGGGALAGAVLETMAGRTAVGSNTDTEHASGPPAASPSPARPKPR